DQLVVLEARAEPDAASAEPHERHVAAVALAGDAGAARARQDQASLRRIEDGVAVGSTEQRRGGFVPLEQSLERGVGFAKQLAAPLRKNQVVVRMGGVPAGRSVASSVLRVRRADSEYRGCERRA